MFEIAETKTSTDYNKNQGKHFFFCFLILIARVIKKAMTIYFFMILILISSEWIYGVDGKVDFYLKNKKKERIILII